jgi:NhaP-type Na+/H+ or K+/H+ antiporter
MILITRPLAVYLSTIGAGLTWQERLFIGWMAPRGIVAAAVSSIFAEELHQEGFTADDPELLVSYTFAVIITTVTIYSLTAGRVARALNLSEKFPQGVLIVGAQAWARQIGVELHKLGFRVIMADSNPSHIQAAQQHPKREILTALREELTRKFVEALLGELGIPLQTKLADMTKEDRKTLSKTLGRGVPLYFIQRRPGDEFVTA